MERFSCLFMTLKTQQGYFLIYIFFLNDHFGSNCFGKGRQPILLDLECCDTLLSFKPNTLSQVHGCLVLDTEMLSFQSLFGYTRNCFP